MRRLVFQPSAREDLNDILRYIARQSRSREVAASFVQVLREQCRALASLPGTLGRSRPDLGNDTRSFSIRGYVIVFRYEPGPLRVISVSEGHRIISPPDDPT